MVIIIELLTVKKGPRRSPPKNDTYAHSRKLFSGKVFPPGIVCVMVKLLHISAGGV
jgi:hypothetical protein